MKAIITRESNFNMFAKNKSSGACGIPQALPCSKLGNMNLSNQVKWTINYIKNRYGNPAQAWEFWKQNNWY